MAYSRVMGPGKQKPYTTQPRDGRFATVPVMPCHDHDACFVSQERVFQRIVCKVFTEKAFEFSVSCLV